ncbi:MAG: toxin-antitoxin system, antitoxin component, Xre family protein [Gammaproteobacteria bacterium]|nr:toxin-antitoxin system, antitoxin component, Xre family protein [Gammaproteobacteria bacterium]
MAAEHNHIKTLIDKLETLPQERLDEVEDFVDFLKQRGRDRQLTRAATQVAEQSFANVWDNSDDSIYDQL